MFRKSVTQTLLTSDLANEVFPNIYGSDFNGDVSFVATLRALVSSRIPEDDHIEFRYKRIGNNISRYSDEESVRLIRENAKDASITLIDIQSGDAAAWLDRMEQNIGVHDGMKRLERITQFFEKAFRILCWIDQDRKSVLLLTDHINIRQFHYLQRAILAMLPWYFDPGKGLSAEEMALLESLRQKTETDYEKCIADFAAKYDFRAMRIKRDLAGFEAQKEKDELRNRMNDLAYYRDKIVQLQEQIGSYLSNMRDTENLIMGLNARIAKVGEEDSPIMQYFLMNPRLVIESVGGDGVMKFGVRDYLTFFDEDHAKAMIENLDSVLYRPNDRSCDNIIPDEDMRLFYSAVFLDQSVKIRMCAVYSIQIGGGVSACGQYRYGPEYNTYLPNPHIHCYSCMGQYSQHINECLMAGNYVGAVEQCASSCRSLNVDDYPVISEFARMMYGISDYLANGNTCVELPDGRVVKPKRAIKYLKGEEIDG